MLPQANSKLVPPNLPFASNVSLAHSDSPFLGAQSSLSLSVNYLPTKFSDAVLYNGLKNRGKAFPLGPKRGGGREAFRSGEARMPGDGDEDYDGIQGSFFTKEGGRTKPRLRWNGFKWTLFLSNFLVSILLSLSSSSSPSSNSNATDFLFWDSLCHAVVLCIFPRWHHICALYLV
jgi:hypothetical protein